MNYISSYESGRLPFSPDKTRGSWTTPGDFFFVALGLAFKLDLFTLTWEIFFNIGIYGVVMYVISLGLCVVPLLVVQSFLGQFSSSGFISALRISPIFKVMGYISIALNFFILTYYSIYGATPLLYFVHSLRPTLPWSCEGFSHWAGNITDYIGSNICNTTFAAVQTKLLRNSSNHNPDEDYTDDDYANIPFQSIGIPSVMFYKVKLIGNGFEDPVEYSWHFVLELVGCTLFIWSLIAIIFHKFGSTEKLGQFLHLMIWSTLTLMIVCLTRFLFLTGSRETLKQFFTFRTRDFLEGLALTPMHAMQSFGPGWGSMITIASFNKFQTKVIRQSWLICLGQMCIFLAFGLMTNLVQGHLTEAAMKLTNNTDTYYSIEHQWVLFLSSGSALATMRYPNFWSLLYFGMLTLAAIIVMVTHAHSLFTSLFDEFVYLRPHKREITFGLLGTWALLSLNSCTFQGIASGNAMTFDSMIVQIALNLLLLLVVLWVYGRERFQRDIEFMSGEPFASWKVNMLRFVAPLFLLFSMLILLSEAYIQHQFMHTVINIIMIICISVPWLLAPTYLVYIVVQSTGRWDTRLKRACQPTDWYPVEKDDRQRYDDIIGNADIAHQLDDAQPEQVFPGEV